MSGRFLRAAAALLAAAVLFPVPAGAISASAAIMLDGTTGRVLYEKQADRRSLIASTTKIMTALVVCEQCNVLDRVKIPAEAVGVEGSSMYLRQDEVLTVQELLYGLMLSSGNDAATALAIYCGGTVSGFVQMMNDKARFLRLDQTHFANPHGLDQPEHYSTARDLACLASHAMKNPIFAATVRAKTVTVSGRTLTNHNRLLWRVEGADGVKTGFTRAAGRALVSSAVRDGRRLIVVTLNDPNDWADHEALYRDGFSNYRMRQIVSRGQCLGTLPVLGGDGEQVRLLAMENYSCPVGQQEQPCIRISAKSFVFAPVFRGADAGFAYICIDGHTIGRVPVCYGDTVQMRASARPSLWQRLFGGAEA